MKQGSTRRVTSADVARSLGLSRATVGFVLNDTPGQTIPEATRKRVLAEAARLGYRPHTAAQALARGSSRMVLFVLPDWPMDFRLRQHLVEAERELDQAGYSMVTYTPHEGGRARPLWEVLDPDVVVGLTPFDADTFAAIRACGITRIVPGEAKSGSLTHQPHHVEGPRLQVDHLLERGHRALGIAASTDPRIAELSEMRVAAAVKRAAELGLPTPNVRHVALADDLRATDAADPAEAPAAAVAAWRAAGVTAVAAYNDDVAAAVAGAALRAGLSVPGDLAVVGHDDTPLARLFVPALSSVDLDVRGVGRYVASLALAATGHRHAGDDAGQGEGAPMPETRTRVVQREST